MNERRDTAPVPKLRLGVIGLCLEPQKIEYTAPMLKITASAFHRLRNS